MLIQVGVLKSFVYLLVAMQGSDVTANLQQDTSAVPKVITEPVLYPLENVWAELPATARDQVDRAILTAYPALSGRGSSDLVLIDEAVREKFLAAARVELTSQQLNEHQPVDSSVFVWRLLSLRKAGKLPPSQGRPKYPPLTDRERLVAEIASRRAEDQFHRSLDRILVDDQGRAFFAAAVNEIAVDVELEHVRRAALALRKARQLRPELSARLVDWPIEQRSLRYSELVADLKAIPEQPGIYLFRDQTGYLYIGEAKDLRARLTTHVTDSDREALFHYLQEPDRSQVFVDLHVFPSDSPGATLSVRRAYESELIRSRDPKFNLRP